MSPISTFHNSGNSSNLYFRNFAPKGVMRLSPFTETELPEWLTIIERNLYMVNSLPCCPTLFCLKITGPPDILIRIKRATTNRTGDKKIRPKKEPPRSKRDFNNIIKKSSILISSHCFHIQNSFYRLNRNHLTKGE
jgi:hypothetical protein